VFAIKAANKGIRTVLFSDVSHHSNHIASLLDLLTGHYGKHGIDRLDPDIKIACVEREYFEEGIWDEASQKILLGNFPWERGRPVIKDWRKAMASSDLFPEMSKPSRQPEEICPLSDEEIPPRIGSKPGGKGGPILPRM